MDEGEDGRKTVRIAGEVREETRTVDMDGETGETTVYVYDEVLFTLEAGRTETIQDIEESLEAWWEYGSQEEAAMPTLEERVAMLEDYIISGGDI